MHSPISVNEIHSTFSDSSFLGIYISLSGQSNLLSFYILHLSDGRTICYYIYYVLPIYYLYIPQFHTPRKVGRRELLSSTCFLFPIPYVSKIPQLSVSAAIYLYGTSIETSKPYSSNRIINRESGLFTIVQLYSTILDQPGSEGEYQRNPFPLSWMMDH